MNKCECEVCECEVCDCKWAKEIESCEACEALRPDIDPEERKKKIQK